MIDPATDRLEIVKIPTFELKEVGLANDEYIDKSSDRISHIFSKTWIFRYPRARKVVFDNGSEFKQDFNPLLKDPDIKTILTLVKMPQSNAPVEQVHQVILNMLVNKDLENKVFKYIDPWGETLAYISWEIRDSYHRTITATSVQSVFGRYMLFNLASVIDW